MKRFSVAIALALIICVSTALYFFSQSDRETHPIVNNEQDASSKPTKKAGDKNERTDFKKIIEAAESLPPSRVADMCLDFWETNFDRIRDEITGPADPVKGLQEIGSIPRSLSENVTTLPDIESEIQNGQIIGVGECHPGSDVLLSLLSAYGGALVEDFHHHFADLASLLGNNKIPTEADLFFYRVFTQKEWVLNDIVEVEVPKIENPLDIASCLTLCQHDNPVARAIGAELARKFLVTELNESDFKSLFDAFHGESNPVVINQLLMLADLIRSDDALVALHSFSTQDVHIDHRIGEQIRIIENR